MTLAQPKDTPISDELRAALQWWLDQAESAEPVLRVRSYGLCSTIKRRFPDVSWELRAALTATRGTTVLPFGRNYFVSYDNGTKHLCPKRRAWVRAMIAEAPRKEV